MPEVLLVAGGLPSDGLFVCPMAVPAVTVSKIVRAAVEKRIIVSSV
jgi:hypothetical protein